MAGKRQSLAEYGKTEGVAAGPKCWLCGIPEKEEVEQAVLSGQVTKAAAARWLKHVCGYTQASIHRVDNHFGEHVRRSA